MNFNDDQRKKEMKEKIFFSFNIKYSMSNEVCDLKRYFCLPYMSIGECT